MPIIYLFFPETKGLELEAVDRIFDVETANPVKESLKAERRAMVRSDDEEQIANELGA